MFEARSYKRIFYSAPQPVASLVAALLEPAIVVLTYVVVCAWFDESIVRSDLSLCLLVLALTFPGRNRFKDRLLTAAVNVVASWTSMSIVGPRTHALVHGHRGETDTVGKMQARVEYDLQSLRNGSLGLDLQTIARTFTLILRGRRVY